MEDENLELKKVYFHIVMVNFMCPIDWVMGCPD